ncbi:MAG: carbohydrate ABC transporter permease [Tepidisphaeraceae bacterium]
MLICSGFLLPFAWMISTSLKTNEQAMAFPPTLVPNPAVPGNYLRVLTHQKVDFPLYTRNTLIIAALTVVGTTLSSAIVAYGFAKIPFKGRSVLFAVMLSTMMIPFPVLMISLFSIFRFVGDHTPLQILGTFKPLWLPAWFGSAFNIFLLRQFFPTIPNELGEAARIDGCSEWGIFWRVVLPLSRPALAVVALFSFMNSWNSFLPPADLSPEALMSRSNGRVFSVVELLLLVFVFGVLYARAGVAHAQGQEQESSRVPPILSTGCIYNQLSGESENTLVIQGILLDHGRQACTFNRSRDRPARRRVARRDAPWPSPDPVRRAVGDPAWAQRRADGGRHQLRLNDRSTIYTRPVAAAPLGTVPKPHIYGRTVAKGKARRCEHFIVTMFNVSRSILRGATPSLRRGGAGAVLPWWNCWWSSASSRCSSRFCYPPCKRHGRPRM